MATPRVAVIGGGISGTLCSLVLQHRGVIPTVIDQGRRVGGRLSLGGAQILRAADPRLAAVYETFCQENLLQSYDRRERTGVLGSSAGGFLPLTQIPRLRTSEDAVNNRSQAADGGDFCHFVEGSAAPTFVGNLEHLCSNILERSQIASVSSTTVLAATPSPDGWHLQLQQQPDSSDCETHFDGLVVATHDASFAGGIVKTIANAEVAAGASVQEPILERLHHLANNLQSVRQSKMSVYTLRFSFPEDVSDEIPFDAVTVPGSNHVQFLSRRDTVWTAVSTSQFATALLAQSQLSNTEKHQEAHQVLMDEVLRLLAPFSTTVVPTEVSVKRWGAAFCAKSLDAQHDSIALHPWRFTICGDYIRSMGEHATPLEAAAISGLSAGEQTASYFNPPTSQE